MEQVEGCYGCRMLARRVADAQATIAALQTQLGDLTVKYKNLVAWYDKQNGTPCEQVRHQQEVEAQQAQKGGVGDGKV